METQAEILVVDDDPLLRLGIIGMLREWGYAPIAAHDPQRALPLAYEMPGLNVLITDYQMPGMNGIELARLMVEILPKLHVLIITGNENLPDHLSPDWKMLIKPFTPYDLRLALHDMRLS